MIRLYCIQPKQLEEMTILNILNGEQSINANSNSSVSPTPQLNTAVERNGDSTIKKGAGRGLLAYVQTDALTLGTDIDHWGETAKDKKKWRKILLAL